MLTFCTLFDSNYLDKGLVLHESLENVISDYKLYILAMDDKCDSILRSMKLPHVIVISMKDFEDEELLEIKKKRAKAEYCWTCTASLIEYVLDTYKEDFCTYIDSDLFFYRNPKVLIEEMCNSNCSVQIVEHGFGKGWRAKQKEKRAGKYCVEFNTFKNDKYGREILSVWNKQCRNHCSMAPGEMGDQKYLSDWAQKYDKVHVLQHQGAGVAPWNLFRFKQLQNGLLLDKKTKQKIDLIFYHFHHLEFVDENIVNVNVCKKEFGCDITLMNNIYIPYLKKLQETKKVLKHEFEIAPMIKKHPGVADNDVRKKVQKMSVLEFIWKARYKMVYMAGRKKDIIDLRTI